jgi:hypothetical protein
MRMDIFLGKRSSKSLQRARDNEIAKSVAWRDQKSLCVPRRLNPNAKCLGLMASIYD